MQPPVDPKNDVTALILAGGEGRRFGGADKGLITVGGRPLVSHVSDALQGQVKTLMISANRNLSTYQALGYEVVTDEIPGLIGPLAGFVSGLRQVKTPYLVTVPCDAPRVAPDLVERLLHALIDSNSNIAVAHDGSRLQAVHTLIDVRVLPHLQAFLEAGNRKVQDWIRTCSNVEVDFSDAAEYFRNVNTPADYQRLDSPGD